MIMMIMMVIMIMMMAIAQFEDERMRVPQNGEKNRHAAGAAIVHFIFRFIDHVG